MKNPWGKTVKREKAYYVVEQGGWTWYVLKAWGDPRKEYARMFCVVTSPCTGASGDMGDVYASEIPGATDAWVRAATALQAETVGGQST